MFGAPALAEGFAHYPYVNPDAPKGGGIRIAAIGGFDNLNAFTIKGNPAQGLGLTHATLMDSSLDEVGVAYGLAASHAAHPEDFSSVTFTLDPRARFDDGHPMTADDVGFSLAALRDAHPFYRAYYADVAQTEILSEHKIRFVFATTGNRELPLILGQLPILPKHFWTGRSLKETTLDIAPASGPYRIAAVEAGRSIAYERVPDYWARDLNVNVGRHNFDTLRYVYFGDDTIAFEALKAGDVDFRLEYSSRLWATGYDTPAIAAGKLKRETLAFETGSGMQAFVFNMRRAPFDSRNVRAALNWAYDFEWTNKNLFYGQYRRTGSFFEGSELAAHGLPSDDELALLAPLRGRIPDAVFDTAYANPITDASGSNRAHLRKARALLEADGWRIIDGKLQRDGKALTMEFLIVLPAFERIVAPFIRNLEKLGIDAKMRIVDASQYQNRLTDYDFDVIVASFPQSLSPGNEQRDYWSSAAADRAGGRNYAGIKDKAVDALVEKLIFAPTRAAQIAAARALDRVLLANHYVLPQWHTPHERLAYWNRLERPDPMPRYNLGFPSIWWHAGGER